MRNDVKLTNLTKTSGCAAKIGPSTLEKALKTLPRFYDENVIVGFDTSDDACVYKVNENTVIIQTVDFFPPMVDDPYTFGQIAATNALSDIYAMGGNPSIAMNLLCFPSCLDSSIMHDILAGGCNKVAEAGAVIVGGHTIADATPKYGLSVSGFAHPKDILTNSNSQSGDVLVITKPIGIGIMNTAAKAGLLSSDKEKEIINIMTTLNKYAKEMLKDLKVNSCTDVTGFSLLGHSYEMAKGSRKSIELFTNEIPIISDALNYASMGILPEGMYNNLDYLKDKFLLTNNLPQEKLDVMLDPQTSGGLLISMPEKDALKFTSRMEEFTPHCKIIGQVLNFNDKHLFIK